jgi:DNA polymerase-3 subunit epsilon
VCHTHFDRVSIGRAFAKYKIDAIPITWLDSARVARRTWEDCARFGYGLANLCEKIGYECKHHDALEDAKACGKILVAAINKSGIQTINWLEKVNRPINPHVHEQSHEDGAEDGPLYGELLVFTGFLEVIRRDAAKMAAKAGCTVDDRVTSKTSILVVGDQDIIKLHGKEKSSKHLKAESLIANGQKIRIVQESDFKELVNVFTGGSV